MVRLEVGKRYKSRRGGIIKIIEFCKTGPFADIISKGDNGCWYKLNGCYYSDEAPSKYDLVEEVKETEYYGVTQDYVDNWVNNIAKLGRVPHRGVYSSELNKNILNMFSNSDKLVNTINKEETRMDMKKFDKKNLKEAKKQYEAEKANQEIEYAKKEMRIAEDNINKINRDIKELEEQRKEYEETIKLFK